GMVGLNAAARRVGLFIGDGASASLTGDGWALVRAAIAWATSAADTHACFTPLDVMQVLDRSGSMAGQKLTDAKSAAKGFVDAVRLSSDQIGVASFSDGASLAHGLSHHATSIK